MTLVNFGDWAAQWDELEEAWSVTIISEDGDDADLMLIMTVGYEERVLAGITTTISRGSPHGTGRTHSRLTFPQSYQSFYNLNIFLQFESFYNLNNSKSFQHIPFKNPFAKTAAEEQVKFNIDQMMKKVMMMIISFLF